MTYRLGRYCLLCDDRLSTTACNGLGSKTDFAFRNKHSDRKMIRKCQAIPEPSMNTQLSQTALDAWQVHGDSWLYLQEFSHNAEYIVYEFLSHVQDSCVAIQELFSGWPWRGGGDRRAFVHAISQRVQIETVSSTQESFHDYSNSDAFQWTAFWRGSWHNTVGSIRDVSVGLCEA